MTSAAVIMVAVFSILATLPIVDTKILGVGLAAAVLVDATVVRGSCCRLPDPVWYRRWYAALAVLAARRGKAEFRRAGSRSTARVMPGQGQKPDGGPLRASQPPDATPPIRPPGGPGPLAPGPRPPPHGEGAVG